MWDTEYHTEGHSLAHYVGDGALQVQLNSEIIPPEHWESRIVRANDELIILPLWEAQAVPYLIAFAISTAISVGLSYIFRPTLPGATEPFDQTYGFSGVSSTRGRGGPVPWIYGRRRVGIRTLSSETIYDSTVIDNGTLEQGFAIENVTGGQNSHDDASVDTPITITITGHGRALNETVIITGVEGKTRANGTWRIQQVTANTFDLANSEGIDPTAYVASTGTATFEGLAQFDATDENARFNVLGAFCVGEIEGVELDSIELNNQPIGNHPKVMVETRNGTPTQAVIPGFDEFRESLPDGFEFDTLNAEHIYTTTRDVDAFVLNLDFRQGLSHLDDQGRRSANAVEIRYRYRLTGGANPWIAERTVRVRGAKPGPLRFGIRRENIATDTYDIGVTVTWARQQNATSTWKPTLTTVTEVVASTENYPNTALIGVRGVASADLNGAIPNITAILKGRKVRVGSFGATPTYSENPPWCAMDLLTQGYGVPDSHINLGAFQVVAPLCDALVDGDPRHTTAYVIDTRQPQQQVLGELLRPSGMEMLYTYGQYSPYLPQGSDQPVQVFSWASTRSATFRGGLDLDGINVLEVQWPDPDESGQQNFLTWPTEGNQPAEVRSLPIQIRSAAPRPEIIRTAQRLLNQRMLETETVDLETTLSGFYCQKGDVIGISSSVMGVGAAGRVDPNRTSTTSLVQLDQEVTLIPGRVYHLYVMHPSGILDDVDVVNSGTTTSALTLSETLVGVPVDADTMWVLGEKTPNDTAIELYRITDVSLVSDDTVRIRAKIHNPSIYDDPVATPLPVVSNFPNANAPPPPLTSLVVNEVRHRLASGAKQSYVQLSWDVAPRGLRTAPYGGVTILRRQTLSSAGLGTSSLAVTTLSSQQNADDASLDGYEELPAVTGNVFQASDFTVIEGATYTYRVIPCSSRGVKNNTGWIERTITISGGRLTSDAPGPPVNLDLFVLGTTGEWIDLDAFSPDFFGSTEAEFMGRDIQFRWEPPTTGDPDIIGYRIRITDSAGLYVLREVLIGVQQNYAYYHADNLDDAMRIGLKHAVRGVKFYIWARTADLESVSPATFTATNPAPNMSLIAPEVISAPEQALIRWTQFDTPSDTVSFDIYADTVSPPRVLNHTISGLTKQTALFNLTPGETMYVQVAAHDDFGPAPESNWSQITEFVVGAFPSEIDNTPPEAPNNPALTQVITEQPDGTQIISVRATWTSSQVPLPDWGHQVDISLDGGTSILSTVLIGPEQVYQYDNAPGNSEVWIRVSVRKPIVAGPFSDWVSIVTFKDNTVLAAPTGLSTESTVKGNVIYFNGVAAGTGYKHTEIWGAQTNDRGAASLLGTTIAMFLHKGLTPESHWYYWARHITTSGTEGTWSSATNSGHHQQVTQTATYLDTLLADNLIASTIQVLLELGVGNLIQLDGNQGQIVTRFDNGNVATIQGMISASPSEHGFVVFNEAGNIMFHAGEEGVTAFGIKTGVLQASHINTATAFINDTAHIQNLVVDRIHINNGAVTSRVEVVAAPGQNSMTHTLHTDPAEREEAVGLTVPQLKAADGTNAADTLIIHAVITLNTLQQWDLGQTVSVTIRETNHNGTILEQRPFQFSQGAADDVGGQFSIPLMYTETITADATNRRFSLAVQLNHSFAGNGDPTSLTYEDAVMSAVVFSK